METITSQLSYPDSSPYAKDKQITLAQFMLNLEVQQHLCTPLSQQAAEELCQLNEIIVQSQQNQQGKDIWGYIWGNTQYNSSRNYAFKFNFIEA
jgi:hypothetical protein